MMIEQLEKANAIQKDLKKKKDFLKAFDDPCSNCIKACTYDRGFKEEIIYLENEKALSDFIRAYVCDQIAELEKQLKEL